ncbi:MAG: hypothetical protein ACKOCM_06205, partial [Cyanobacteriota bacterium]
MHPSERLAASRTWSLAVPSPWRAGARGLGVLSVAVLAGVASWPARSMPLMPPPASRASASTTVPGAGQASTLESGSLLQEARQRFHPVGSDGGMVAGPELRGSALGRLILRQGVLGVVDTVDPA